jgi:hypothetical protein
MKNRINFEEYHLLRYTPEDDTLHNYRRENLKSYIGLTLACIGIHPVPSVLGDCMEIFMKGERRHSFAGDVG